MRNTDLITDRELRDATAIHTIDPSHPDAAGHQLWGSKTVRSQDGMWRQFAPSTLLPAARFAQLLENFAVVCQTTGAYHDL